MKYETELISIIVPVYNVERYLERCVDSIINQTYRNLEIILVDDGSTDKSSEICDRYEKKDNRVRVLHKRNGGAASARNKGLEVATGEYIGFVDSDDYIASDMYEALYRHMREDVDVVTCGMVYIDRSGHKKKYYCTKEMVCFDNIQSLRELLCQRYLVFSPCDKLFKKKAIGKIRYPNNRVCEDLLFIYNVVKDCNNIINIGECKYYYIYRENSVSRKMFYARRMDYVLFARDILKDVSVRYPSLRKEAELLYVKNTMDIINQINKSPNKSSYEYMRKRLVKVIRKMLLLIILNPHITYEQKIKCILLK